MVRRISCSAPNQMIRDETQIERILPVRAGQNLSRVFEMPDLSVSGQVLSAPEAGFFDQNGFLVKRGLVDRRRLNHAMGRIWEHLLAHLPGGKGLPRRDRSRRSADSTWEKPPAYPTDTPCRRARPLECIGRTVKLHRLGREEYLQDLLPRDPNVLEVAARLLGGKLSSPMVSRGVYAVFPSARHDHIASAVLSPHVDQVDQVFGACLYLEDVAERSGGFTVYPGTHRLKPEANQCRSEVSRGAFLTPAVASAIDKIEPCELVAERGTVIFWHGRLVHSPGVHTGRGIRWAHFADYSGDIGF